MTIESLREQINILLKKYTRRKMAADIGISRLTLERFSYGANITIKTLDKIIDYLNKINIEDKK